MAEAEATIEVEHASRRALQRRDRIGIRLIYCALIILVAAVIGSLAIGPTGISLADLGTVFEAAARDHWSVEAQRAYLVLFDLRLPRTLVGCFVGAALALSGAMMQGLFRNPLADPGLVGVSAGAALAAIATIALGDGIAKFWVDLFGIYALPLAAFFGGLLTTTMLMAVAGRNGELLMGTLLLAGIAFAALAGALSGLIAYVSDDTALRDLTLWSMGSLSGSSWTKVAAVAPFAVVLCVAMPSLVRLLNALLLGEAEAFHLGINVGRAKLAIVALTAAGVGAAVAVAGVIGFIGIVVPHFIRLIAGPDHRTLLAASALGGAALLLIADILARIVVQPAELPIGIIMALIGAPVFLHLVLRRGALGGV